MQRTTSFDLTDAIADFYNRNPAIKPPKRSKHGYAIDPELTPLLEDLVTQINRLQTNKGAVPNTQRTVVAQIIRNNMRSEVFAYFHTKLASWLCPTTHNHITNAFTSVLAWRETREGETTLPEIDPESLGGSASFRLEPRIQLNRMERPRV